MDTTQQPQIDKSVVNLMKAVKQHESGSNYNAAPENAGVSLGGAYMYQKPTWELYSKEILGDPNTPFTPENQDKVTYGMMKKWKDSGMQPEEVIHQWNPGDPTYVDKVKNVALNQIPQKNEESNPFSEGIKDIPQGDVQAPGNFLSNLGKGNVGDALASAARDVGNTLTFGGTEQLGNQVGNSLATIGGKVKGLTGSQDYSKFVPKVDNTETLKAAGKIILGTGITAATPLLKGLIGGESALANPEVVKILEGSIGKGETIKNLSRQEALNTLGNYLKEMSVSESGSKTEQAVLKAIKELDPTIKESLLKKFVKNSIKTAGGAAIAGAGFDKGRDFIKGLFK